MSGRWLTFILAILSASLVWLNVRRGCRRSSHRLKLMRLIICARVFLLVIRRVALRCRWLRLLRLFSMRLSVLKRWYVVVLVILLGRFMRVRFKSGRLGRMIRIGRVMNR